jgi:hypothetical protein
MYVCKVCNEEFKCLKQLGGHTSKHRKSKQQLNYELHPKLCKECFQPISWKSYMSKRKNISFCSKTCRAKHFFKNNSKFGVKVTHHRLNNSSD